MAIIAHSIAYWSEEDMAHIIENHPEYVKKYNEFTQEMSKKDLADDVKERNV